MEDSAHKALVIAFDDIEEAECLIPVDILRRAGLEVTLASIAGNRAVTGRNQITFYTDTDLSQIDPNGFDLIVLPGGPGVLEQADNERLDEILLAQHRAQKPLAAICAAPKLLASKGILDGRSATSHASVRADLAKPNSLPVVRDGHITTSQGVGTAIEFSLELVSQLMGAQAAREIANSIHY